MSYSYNDELRNLIDLIKVSIEELDSVLETMTEGDFSRNMTLAWHHINGILIYTNRISRFFWNNKNKKAETRSKQLREDFGINDNSILHFEKRTVRDNYDHIDEKIDDIGIGNFRFSGDQNIGDIKNFVGNLGVGDYMRHYDPTTKTIYYGDFQLDLNELLIELKNLEKNIK